MAEIKKARGIDATLIPGSGGQLEVVLDGKLIFSKKQTGRWPEVSELLEMIPTAS